MSHSRLSESAAFLEVLRRVQLAAGRRGGSSVPLKERCRRRLQHLRFPSSPPLPSLPLPSLQTIMTEHYPPSIHVEAPSDRDSARLPPLGLFDTSYGSSFGPNDMMNFGTDQCYSSSTPTLFLQLSDSLSPSELSPSEDFSGGYSPASDYRSPSGRNSPIDPWSPASSYSSVPDVSADDFSEEFLPYLSGHSSPSAVSPSLSPLTGAFGDFSFEEQYPGQACLEQSVLPNGPPTVSRLRSSSQSVQSVSPSEVWSDGVGRGRASSFSGSTNDTQFYRNTVATQQEQYAGVQIAVADANSPFQSFGTEMAWMPQTESSPTAPRPHLAPEWTLPGSERASADSLAVPTSPSLLAVPGPGLRRRPATYGAASRRSRSHGGETMIFPDQDSGRGRGQHRSTLSIPNSRSTSNGSRSGSRAPSPHEGAFYNAAAYSPSSPSSPAFEDAVLGNGSISVERRSTFTALRAPAEILSPVATLSRASTTPSRGRRPKPIPSLRKDADLHMLKAVKTEPSSSSLASSGLLHFHVSPPSVPSPFKEEVSSKKIREASSRRRINIAAFNCPLATCGATFTARHNLTNHINSHNKHRPYRCLCGLTFTTQGVLNRHKKRCCK
ncbi:hypothetical protein C8R46DRAFT_1092142 [Mycena filopes]|nr:hypothetical protein C8R46DRAFT_1092142 [Mycena filopes]